MKLKKNFELTDKVCVVTGGAGLLGKEFIDFDPMKNQ